MIERASAILDRIHRSIKGRLSWKPDAQSPLPARVQRIGLKLGYDQHGNAVHRGNKTIHTLVIAGTGGGKSNDFKWLARQSVLDPEPRAVIVVDGNGGARDSVLHNIVELIDQLGLADTRPVVLFDTNHPTHVTCTNPLAHSAGSDISVVSVAVLTSIASGGHEQAFNDKPTLRNNLAAVLAAGAALGLTIPDVEALCDLDDPDHLREWAIDHLEDDYPKRELRRMQRMAQQRSVADYTARLQGTENRLNDLTRSRAARASLGGHAQGVNLAEVIAAGGIILINGEGSQHASEPDARAYANVVLSSIVRYLVIRDPTIPVDLFIDECQHFLGSDAEPMFREFRKRKCSATVATQVVETFEKVPGLLAVILGTTECKMFGRVMTMANAELAAREVFEADLESPVLASVRPVAVGQRRTTFNGSTQGSNETTGVSNTEGVSHGHSVGHTRSRSKSTSESTMRFSSRSETHAQSSALGESDSLSDMSFSGIGDTASTGSVQTTSTATALSPNLDFWDRPYDIQGYNQGAMQGTTAGSARNTSRGSGTSRGRATQRTNATSDAYGAAEGEGTSFGTSEAEGVTHSHSRSFERNASLSRSSTRGTSTGTSISEGMENVYQDLPQSFHSLQHIQHRIAHMLKRLQPGQMVVSLHNQVQLLKIPEVKDTARSLAELQDLKTQLLLRNPFTMKIEDAIAACIARRKALCAEASPSRPEPGFAPQPVPGLDDILNAPGEFAAGFWKRQPAPAKPRVPKRPGRETKPGEPPLTVIDGGRNDGDSDA
jgi:hypothetical protein